MSMLSLRPLVPAALALLALSTPRAARAEGAEAGAEPEPLGRQDLGVSDHLEFTMGFLSERRAYDNVAFHASGPAGVAGAAALSAPFHGAPFTGVQMNGLRYELRLVASHVRMTVGTDLPFASYNVDATTAPYSVGGATRQVSVSSLSDHEIHFGIGAEYPLGPVVPFVDVVGSMRWLGATLDVGGTPVDYSATTFGFAARGGARVHVRRWLFLAAAGEVGFVNNPRWGAELSVGFALGL